MSEITFTYQIPPKSIGGFEIDAFIRERYSFGNTVTDIPMEDGRHASDHVVEKATEIHISGFIGNVEFVTWDGPLPEPSEAMSRDPKERIRSAYFELMRLKASRQPLDLVTGLDTYRNMVITSFEIDRDAANGADLPFEMAFKQVRIIRSQTTTITATNPAADQIAEVSNMGVAGTSITEDNSNFMKDAWRAMYRKSGGSLPTREEFFRQWSEYP